MLSSGKKCDNNWKTRTEKKLAFVQYTLQKKKMKNDLSEKIKEAAG